VDPFVGEMENAPQVARRDLRPGASGSCVAERWKDTGDVGAFSDAVIFCDSQASHHSNDKREDLLGIGGELVVDSW